MERLTMTSPQGGVALTFNLDVICNRSEIIKILKMAEKLKGYEDAEEKGLLLILPVAPGETVYLIDNNTDACDECENFVVGYCEEYCKCNDSEYPQCTEEPLCEKQFLEVIEFKTNQKWILENKDDFGKSIFLTREEAEAALKKMQEEQK